MHTCKTLFKTKPTQSRSRIPKSQRSGVLSISASYEGETREVGFTLTAYAKANMKMSWIKPKSTPPYTQKAMQLFGPQLKANLRPFR